jgi:hypothetical protein
LSEFSLNRRTAASDWESARFTNAVEEKWAVQDSNNQRIARRKHTVETKARRFRHRVAEVAGNDRRAMFALIDAEV